PLSTCLPFRTWFIHHPLYIPPFLFRRNNIFIFIPQNLPSRLFPKRTHCTLAIAIMIQYPCSFGVFDKYIIFISPKRNSSSLSYLSCKFRPYLAVIKPVCSLACNCHI